LPEYYNPRFFYFNEQINDEKQLKIFLEQIKLEDIEKVEVIEIWRKSHRLSFRMLLSAFPKWWIKFKDFTTGQWFLLLLVCYPIGFLFAEVFYDLATITIKPLKRDYLTKVDFDNNDNLIKKLKKLKIIKEAKESFFNKLFFNKLFYKRVKEDFYYFNYFHTLIGDEAKLRKILWNHTLDIIVTKENFLQSGVSEKTINELVDEHILFEKNKEHYCFNKRIRSEERLKNCLKNIKSITNIDEDKITNFWKNNIILNKEEIGKTLEVWNQSLKAISPLNKSILRTPFHYMNEVNIERSYSTERGSGSFSRSNEQDDTHNQFRTIYYIQKNPYLLKLWEWEQFQFNICLLLEGTLLAFTILFSCSIVLILRFMYTSNLMFFTLASFILLLILLIILVEDGILLLSFALLLVILILGGTINKTGFIGETFCMGSSLIIFLISKPIEYV